MPKLPPSKLTLPFKAIWNKSWTKLLGWTQGVSGAILASISVLNSYLNDSTFKSYLDMMDVPKTVTISLAVLGIITWLAHGREND